MTPQILNLSNFSLDELRTIQKQIEEKLVEERQAFVHKKLDVFHKNIDECKMNLMIALKAIENNMDEAFDDPDICNFIEFVCDTSLGTIFYNQAGFDIE